MPPNQPRSPKLPTGVLYILAVVCAAGIATAAYFALDRPLTYWRLDQSRQADLVREKLAAGPALKALHTEQERELADLLARVEEVNKRVPEEPREGEFLAALSHLAETHQVSIDDFRRGKSTDTETHSVVTVSIRARGSHTGMCSLLDAIANLPRLAELTHLEVKSQPTSGRYPAQLTYALYYGMSATTDGTKP